MKTVICPYCDKKPVLTDSIEVYGVSYGMIWLCKPCNAYVGVHKNSKNFIPLGRLANSELREYKKLAHASFDPLWKKKMQLTSCSKSKARKLAYKWLSSELNIDIKDCHIGEFDIDTCKQVINICSKYVK